MSDTAKQRKILDEYSTVNYALIKKLEGKCEIFDENGEKLEALKLECAKADKIIEALNA